MQLDIAFRVSVAAIEELKKSRADNAGQISKLVTNITNWEANHSLKACSFEHICNVTGLDPDKRNSIMHPLTYLVTFDFELHAIFPNSLRFSPGFPVIPITAIVFSLK